METARVIEIAVTLKEIASAGASEVLQTAYIRKRMREAGIPEDNDFKKECGNGLLYLGYEQEYGSTRLLIRWTPNP